MKGIIAAIAILCSMNAIGQSVVGYWVTIDDESKKEKSVVKLYKKDGKLYGKVKHIFPGPGVDENPKCKECKGGKKNKPILEMQIVNGLKWNGEVWKGGTILDPENGKVYDVKMWLDEDNANRLNVRGYVGIFYRTQRWIRVKK